MGKILQDIWIINNSGIVIYNRVFEEKIDAQLFGALMTALNNFAKELVNEGLSSFNLKKKRYSFAKRNNLLFIVSSDKKYKEKNVHKELEILIDAFFKNYEEELEDWKGEIDIFSDFEKIFHESLEDPIKKLEQGFWY